MEPKTSGTPNNKLSAIAPPKISAKAVAIEAIIAVESTGRESHLGKYFVAASERQSPVTIPK